MAGPDAELAREKYRALASGYDRLSALTAPARSKAVARLGLAPGATVFDIACGTGLTFPYLEERIGPSGRLVGVDLSPEMLRVARRRADAAGWANVMLVEAAIEELELDGEADAAIFVLTHDVMQSPAAIRNVRLARRRLHRARRGADAMKESRGR